MKAEKNPNDASLPDRATDEPLAAAAAKARFGPGNGSPPYRSKIDMMLREEDVEPYEALLRRRAALRYLHKWLLDRGYKVGLGAVERHRTIYRNRFEWIREGSQAAAHFAHITRDLGLSLPDASIGGMHMTLMKYFSEAATLSAGDLRALSAGVQGFIDTYHKAERARRELSKGDAGGNTPEDHAALVDRVRDILGVNLK